MTAATLSARDMSAELSREVSQRIDKASHKVSDDGKREIKADIVIIGAGSAGLSTAHLCTFK